MLRVMYGARFPSVLVLFLPCCLVSSQDIIEGPSNVTYCSCCNTANDLPIELTCRVSGVAAWIVNETRYTLDQINQTLEGHDRNGTNILVYSPASNTKYTCVSLTNDGDVRSDPAYITVIDALPPPIVDLTNEMCTNDFTVSWTPASNEEGLSYDVTLQSGVIFGDSTMDTYNFTGLTPNLNTEYSVSVASVLNSCSGTPNTIMLTTVPSEAGVPQSVSNLKVLKITTNDITVAWDPADSPNCGPVLYYNVTIVNSVNASDMNITEGDKTTTEFCNLINGISYNISVAAVNRAGAGPSSTIIVTTLTDEECLEVPDTDDNNQDSENSRGAIAGIVIGVLFLVTVVIIIAAICIIIYWKMHNRNENGGILSNSPDPGRQTSEKKSDSRETDKAARRKDKPKQKYPKQPNKTEYAELQLSSTGTAPSVDPTKVDYTEVKEHEPLSYAEIQNNTRAGEQPIKGAPPVEYEEV